MIEVDPALNSHPFRVFLIQSGVWAGSSIRGSAHTQGRGRGRARLWGAAVNAGGISEFCLPHRIAKFTFHNNKENTDSENETFYEVAR